MHPQIDGSNVRTLKDIVVKNGSSTPKVLQCTKSELDLFGVPPTQTSVEHGYWEQQGLTSALTDQIALHFVL
jgi:hypothetical protein